MKISTQCPHCGKTFRVAQEAVGRKAKCAKCEQKFLVQADPDPDETVKIDTVIVPPVSLADSQGVPVDSVPVETVPVESASADGVPVETVPVEPHVEVTNSAPVDSVSIAPAAQQPAGPPATTSPAARKPHSMLPWIVAGATSLAAVIAVVAILLRGGDGGGGQGQAPAGKPPARGQGELVLYLGVASKESLSLQLDGAEQSLTRDETQRLPLAAGTYQLRLRRRGYTPIEQSVTVAAGESASITPNWNKVDIAQVASPSATGGAGWVQSVEVAQRTAGQRNQDVLALFIGSDWNPESQQLVRDGLASAAVQQALEDKFQLAVLDYPVTEAMGMQVEDPAHNQWMMDKYRVDPDEMPLLVGMDTDGLPFAMIAAAATGAGLAQQIEAMEELKVKHDRVLRNSGTVLEAERAIDWLDEHNVLVHHRDQVLRWYELGRGADPENQQGALEPFFEAMWDVEALTALGAGDQSRLRQLVKVLSQWHSDKKFKDGDRAARMHLRASIALLQLEDLAAARTLAQQGASYPTTDGELASALKRLPALIDNAGSLGSGSGFVVASGYVLTNYHVVEGPGPVMLGFSDGQADIRAQVVAKDEQLDLALLRAGRQLGPPLPVAKQSPGRGAQVAAFGYPLGQAIGGGLKLTTGVISGLPNANTEQMLLLDIRINPGNSGGPLCDAQGAVVGMVTARTRSGEEVDSYGMAIPAPTVEAFLRRHISGFSPPPPLNVGSGWDRVDAAVNRSVLRVVKMQ